MGQTWGVYPWKQAKPMEWAQTMDKYMEKNMTTRMGTHGFLFIRNYG